MYVSNLNKQQQKSIKQELYNAIKEMGLYGEDEIKEHVGRGMDSKLTDLEDTIDISKYK